MRALIRGGVAFALVWLAYVGYAALAVPMIEPPLQKRAVKPLDAQAAPQQTAVDRQQIEELGHWFQPGDWELDSPKILETPQGYLLLKNYEILPDKEVRLTPCSLVMLPRGQLDEELRRRQAIVLRAPQGAVLRFSEQFDLRKANLGKLQGGRMAGRIEIRSDQREPGPQDDLFVETRDVELRENRIETPHEIVLRLGRSQGRGKGLVIDLRQATKGATENGPAFDGIRKIQILQDVQLTLVPVDKPAATAQPASAAPNSLLGGNGPTPPLHVTCQGPFRFDLESRVATFEKQVSGRTVVEGQAPDELGADLLAVHFESSVVGDSMKKLSGLEPVFLELEGAPAWINAPSRRAQARGNRLRYDLKTLKAHLWGQPEASAVQGATELHGAELHFAAGADGTWGELTARGAGWLRGADTVDPSRVFEASWAKSIEFRPIDGKHLLKIEGQAHLMMPGAGGLDAEQIYALLAPDTDAAPQAGAMGGRLAPQKLFAQGNVRIESPQLSGRLQQLELWFEPANAVASIESPRKLIPTALWRRERERPEFPARLHLVSRVALQQPASPPPAAQPMRPAPNAQPRAAWPQQPAPAPAAPPTQKLTLTAARLQGKIRNTRPEPQIVNLIVDTEVRITSAPIAAPQAATMVLTGDRVDLTQAQPGRMTARLRGRPAQVQAQKMQLAGEEIHVDQGSNRVWLDLPGVIRMEVDRDLQGQPLPAPQIAELTWGGRMDFDGQTARFQRKVTARMQGQELHTEQMDARFSRRIELASARPAAGSAGGAPMSELEALVCRDGVEFNGRTLDERGELLSLERIVAQNLALNQRTGALAAQGPGWMSQVRRGAAALSLGGSPAAPAPTQESKSDSLNYLRVEFQRGIQGNMQQREMTFTHLVTAVFGPVPRWDATLNTDDDVDRLGSTGGRLECDELRVAQLAAPGTNASTVELDAMGNTRIEGAGFSARAARLKYAQAKDMVVLEGDGRSPAQLWWRPTPGAAPSTNMAQRLLFWRSTGQVKQEGGMLVDLPLPPASQPK